MYEILTIFVIYKRAGKQMSKFYSKNHICCLLQQVIAFLELMKSISMLYYDKKELKVLHFYSFAFNIYKSEISGAMIFRTLRRVKQHIYEEVEELL